jgi:hypothetical protein
LCVIIVKFESSALEVLPRAPLQLHQHFLHVEHPAADSDCNNMEAKFKKAQARISLKRERTNDPRRDDI